MSKNKKETMCKLNKLLACSNPTECAKCGWNAPEMKRRKLQLELEGLKRSKDGKYRLIVR